MSTIVSNERWKEMIWSSQQDQQIDKTNTTRRETSVGMMDDESSSPTTMVMHRLLAWQVSISPEYYFCWDEKWVLEKRGRSLLPRLRYLCRPAGLGLPRTVEIVLTPVRWSSESGPPKEHAFHWAPSIAGYYVMALEEGSKVAYDW